MSQLSEPVALITLGALALYLLLSFLGIYLQWIHRYYNNENFFKEFKKLLKILGVTKISLLITFVLGIIVIIITDI